MLRPFAVLAVLIVITAARAQDPAALAAAAEVEHKLVVRAVAGLHALADAWQAQRQHGKALLLRREIWLEYAEDDEKARDRCGFTKVGEAWRLDAQKLVIDKDLTGEAKGIKKIEQEAHKLDKELLAGHRAVAEAFHKAGDPNRAARHWRRVLRFAPGDQRAAEALANARFLGFAGSAMELGMLRRAHAIRGACDWLLRTPFPVRKIEGGTHPLLQRAGLEHRGVRTQHYEVWGTLPEAQLDLVGQHVERALLLCHTLLGTAEGAPFAPRRFRQFVFVADEASYHKVLDQCADQFDGPRLQFLKQEVDLAFVKAGEQDVRFCKTNGGDEEALDQAVRGAVQDAIGIYTEGLWEGLGHAACGFLFGKSLTFLLEQKDERTVATWTQKLLVPDMAVWREIAQQSAWSKSDTRTSELVLISAARFSTEQRVKAWAICDYLFHWRPELLRELDQSRSKDILTPPAVEAEFLRRTGLSLPQIDHDWREFWGKAEALQKAMAADPLGEPKGKDRTLRSEARALVDAVNTLRAAARRGPLGFWFAEGPATQAALGYGEQLVKAELDQQKKPKETIPVPPAPAAIGRTVLWSRRTDAAAAVLDWWPRPSWRDALLHPGRGLLGATRNKHCVVLDLADALAPARGGLPSSWPARGQVAVPGAARAADLGPRALAALAAAGRQPGDVVGMPLSLHFHRAIGDADLAAITARVYAGGLRVEGVVVGWQGAGPDDDTAAGVIAFVPLAPLPAGSEIEIEWTLPKALLGEDEKFAPVRFTVAG